MPGKGIDVLVRVDPSLDEFSDAEPAFTTIARYDGEMSWWSDERDARYPVEVVVRWKPLPA
jgi:hypothetical protein